MIKYSAHIRKFSPSERLKLDAIKEKYKINTSSKCLLFALDKFQNHETEIARLNRIIEYKQRKIERLENQDHEKNPS